MPEQLALFGPSVQVVFEAPPEPEAPPPPPLPPVDPRQCSILEGPLGHIGALQCALLQLDVAAARADWERAAFAYPQWARGESWPSSIDELEAVLQLAASERAGRLIAQREAAAGCFPGLGPELRRELLDLLLLRTSADLLAADGGRALLPDGRAAGFLCLLAGNMQQAQAALAARIALYPRDGRSRGYHAEALARTGRLREALEAFRDAFLVEPQRVDEAWISCEPVGELLDLADELDLPGDPRTWIAVLGDLTGVWPLASARVELSGVSEPWQRVADALLRFRREQRTGQPGEAERIAIKRVLLRDALQLRDLLRRL